MEIRFWLKEGIVIQLLAKAGELEKNPEPRMKKAGGRIKSGISLVRYNQNLLIQFKFLRIDVKYSVFRIDYMYNCLQLN